MTQEALETGSVVDGFVIGERIHSGGMANLWSVHKPGIETALLMKAPKLLDGDDATAIVGFEMEMMILPRLSGAHVPRCYAVGDYARQPYVVMERINGHLLLDRLDSAPLPPGEVAAIGARIATALVDLHRQNVLHLDIKPSNVMMRESGQATLIDFGLSHHLLLPDLLQEEFEVPIGTGPYISPEQLFKIRTDPRSDIFSLGVLLYHFATKVRPFGYPKSQQGLRARLWRDPPPPRSLAPDVPPWLQEIILHCLEPEPDARYPSAAQLLFDLNNPGEVALTARALKTRRDPLVKAITRWFLSGAPDPSPQHRPAAGSIASAPIIMAAIDFSDDSEALADSLRSHVGRVLATATNVRLACVNVLRQARLTINYSVDEQGQNLHVQRLVALKEWARPLGLAPDHMTFHVLEHPDPAQALLEYARTNHVDHILIGARGLTGLRRLLGSVSARVVAEAPCTVTLVRLTGSGDVAEEIVNDSRGAAGLSNS
ncbi:MAG TPA: bifunctional serine/threonine-protein kinase/universal stress protein [Beijerinckiaceae bacterium]|nr:bifunctional serine/threonine-protein kinase/universal stress protein [Beijerinckiaceae bacterium]HVB89284.1 bifunctional serine/threonine-protein kinase/universal stress protein [Beijerinckiaceae bacterium]